jgi:hypothetical protein
MQQPSLRKALDELSEALGPLHARGWTTKQWRKEIAAVRPRTNHEALAHNWITQCVATIVTVHLALTLVQLFTQAVKPVP